MNLPKGLTGFLISTGISILLYLFFAQAGIFAIFFFGGPVIWCGIEKYLNKK